MGWHRCGALRAAVIYDVRDGAGEGNLKDCIAAAVGKVRALAPYRPPVLALAGPREGTVLVVPAFPVQDRGAQREPDIRLTRCQ